MANNQSTNTTRKRKKKKKNNLMRIVRLALVLLVVCAAGVAGYAVLMGGVPDQIKMQVLFDSGVILPTISINGVDVSNKTPAQARFAINDQVIQKAQGLAVRLQYTDRTDLLPAEKIGVYPNADDTIRQAMLQGREGGITKRKSAAASGTVLALTLNYTYDENALEGNIRNASAELNTAPLEPNVSVVGGVLTITDGKDGVNLDVNTFVARVKAAVMDGSFGPVSMPGSPVLPHYKTEDIRANTVLISTSSTNFTDATTSGRGFNIKKMCEMLSGSVVLPGEEFSVNDKAGPRNAENGWQLAKGIENGVYTDQYGGGICQVSTTLYNSLLKADLTITARRPHSIPSSYVPRAQDAAISTGGPDLKFRNETAWPVYLVLRVDEPNGSGRNVNKKVITEVYGPPLPNGTTIKLVSVDKVHTPFDPLNVVYVTDPLLTRSGHDFFVSEAWKVYYDANGKEIRRVRANSSTYNGNKPYVLDPLLLSPSPEISPAPTPTHTP
jgi:vancomycin resistance protein YoaR